MKNQNKPFLKQVFIFFIVFATFYQIRISFFSERPINKQNGLALIKTKNITSMTETIVSDTLSLTLQIEKLQSEISDMQHYKKSLHAVFSIIICGCLPVIALIGYFIYKRNKRKLQLERLYRLNHLQRLRYWESQERIKENEYTISLLEKKLCKSRIQIDIELSEKNSLLDEISYLKNQNKQIELKKVQRHVSYSLLQQSKVYKFIFQNIGNADACLSSEQWKQLGEEIDITFDQFSSRLYTVCPKLNEAELHVCYLLKLSVPLIDIAHFTAHQKSSISTLRERLYKKIYGKKGNGKSLDLFILEF